MAKISLREYIREIENLIDRGETEQAISHCKHILKYYPKHIDSYRLLGKAFLEKQKYGDAGDIFQRVLSSVPEDFISHIGMSIIREDENNLDAAIWHMERAFEVQPSNKAVQDELRRLYANRDGIAPPKIRLTRGALVRMYARGDLYTQAIAEIRAALVEDPNRTDLEVILARLYYLQGQEVEATEVCSKLIIKLPYCYEANRILSEVLQGTPRVEDEKIFRQRVIDLDPYNQFLTDTIKSPAEVPDNAVMVDYLEWDPTMLETDQPDWAQSIGVNLNEDKEEAYEWDVFNASSEEEAHDQETELEQDTFDQDEPVLEKPDLPEESIIPSFSVDDEEEIPEWMKEAGWEVSDKDNVEAEKGFNIDMQEVEIPQADETSELEPAEIPAWLQDMAPEISPAEEDKNDLLEISEDDDEIEKFESLFSASETTEKDQDFSPETPDWLSDLTSEDEPEETSEPIAEPSDSETPDWLSDLTGEDEPEETSEPIAESAASETPDWLSDLTGEDEPEETSEPIAESAASETPDWLSDLTGEDEPEETSEPIAEPTASETPDWLSDLTGEDEPEEISEPIAEPSDSETPDWLSDLTGEDEPEEISEPIAEPTASETPNWLSDLTDEDEPEEAPEPLVEPVTSEIPDWIKGLSEEEIEDETVEIEEDLVSTSITTEEPPEPEKMNWIPEYPKSEISEDKPDEDLAVPTDQTSTTELDEEDAFAWLESLAAKQGAQDGTLLTSMEERKEETPDWIKEALQDEPSEPLITKSEEKVDEIGESVTQEPEISDTELSPTEDYHVQEEDQSDPLKQDFDVSEIEGMDIESAMAWMEGLAAKQGAEEETLSSKPQDRTEEPPEWISKQAQDIIEQQLNSDSIEEDLVSDEQMEALQWLDKKSDSPTDFDTLEEDILSATAQTDRLRPLSDSTKESNDEELPLTEFDQEIGTDLESDDWEISESLFEEEHDQSDDSVTTVDIETEDHITTEPENLPEIQNKTEEEKRTIADIYELRTEEETQTASDYAQEEPMVTTNEGVEDKISLPTEDLAAEEKDISELIQEEDHLKFDYDIKTPYGETINSISTDPENLPEVHRDIEHEKQPITESYALNTDQESQPSSEDQNEINPLKEQLNAAKTALQKGEFETALSTYNELIQAELMLDQVIDDIKQALDSQYPIEISLWQALGDAYLRNEQLEEALNAYSKAEELL
jgi:tetratricopeptide (TPR) repeat protein